MKVNGKAYRSIWEKPGDEGIIQIIDQRWLPHKFIIEGLRTVDEVSAAIRDMHVRGAPLIGVAAAYGMYLAAITAPKGSRFDTYLIESAEKLISTRPTAVNLAWAVGRQMANMNKFYSVSEKIVSALTTARHIADDDAGQCRKIGEHGAKLIREISERKSGETVNILTHCNAGWLATVDWGTATAPIYMARNQGIDLHVWVDETRPRNQGAKLTAWELGHEGINHTVITDNAGGHLMQHGLVDMAIVGSDRTTAAGDVANKIGTYLKALAALDNNVPFYAALPSTTIDWSIEDGLKDIPIEQRNADEVRFVDGLYKHQGNCQCENEITEVLVPPEGSPAANYAFDVTPSRLVTGLITERGICLANKESIAELFPDKIIDK